MFALLMEVYRIVYWAVDADIMEIGYEADMERRAGAADDAYVTEAVQGHKEFLSSKPFFVEVRVSKGNPDVWYNGRCVLGEVRYS